MDTLSPDNFGYFLLQYRDFPFSKAKNVLMIPVGTKNFFIIAEVFYCVHDLKGLLREVSLYIRQILIAHVIHTVEPPLTNP